MQITLEDWARLGEVATPIIAFVGLSVVWWQIRAAQQVADRASAFESYRQFVCAAQEHPQFISPDSRLDVKAEKFDGSGDEFRRYEAFVDLMLSTFEEMLYSAPCRESTKYMNNWLSEHRAYLDSPYFNENFRAELSEKMMRLVYAAGSGVEKGNLKGQA
jgi:hypothetical protein